MKYYILEIKVQSAIKPGKILKDVSAYYSKKEAIREARHLERYNPGCRIKIAAVTPNEEIEF